MFLCILCLCLRHWSTKSVMSSSVSHNGHNGCSSSFLKFFFRPYMCSLVLMMSLTVSPLHTAQCIFHLPFIIFDCSRLCFIPHFPLEFFLDFSFDLLFYEFVLCWLHHFFCCFYIYHCLFTDWVYSALKGFLKTVFTLFFYYIFCYTFFLLTILWYSIIALFSKYSSADHIPVSISTAAVDVDIRTCSNCLSVLLYILFILSISLVSILPHVASPRSTAGIRHVWNSFSFTLIHFVPTWLCAFIAFITNNFFFDIGPS